VAETPATSLLDELKKGLREVFREIRPFVQERVGKLDSFSPLRPPESRNQSRVLAAGLRASVDAIERGLVEWLASRSRTTTEHEILATFRSKCQEATALIADPLTARRLNADLQRMILYLPPRGEGKGGRRKKRRKRNDPETIKRRNAKKKQDAIDREIFSDWRMQEWAGYQDYANWKNQSLPTEWPKLDGDYVRLAIGREKARLKRLGKWPPS